MLVVDSSNGISVPTLSGHGASCSHKCNCSLSSVRVIETLFSTAVMNWSSGVYDVLYDVYDEL